MKPLLGLLDKLEAQIVHHEKIKPTVSNAHIGWHIEHSCLVIIKIAATLNQSNPVKYQWKWNTKRFFVFLIKKFPRGKAQAPASVMPTDAISPAQLTQSIVLAKSSIESIQACAKRQYFIHPIFGELNRSATLYFLAIHTQHHLHIIQDILE
ncbi:MAG: hypothetical protein RLZ56_1187 [Bacteroidota bacterium]|jgi:hypothetical protein